MHGARPASRVRLPNAIDREFAAIVAVVSDVSNVEVPRIVHGDVLPVDVVRTLDVEGRQGLALECDGEYAGFVPRVVVCPQDV